MSGTDHLKGWNPKTPIKVVPNKKGTVADIALVADHTPFVNAMSGEVAFALCYRDKSVVPLNREECEYWYDRLHDVDNTITLEYICEQGNRSDSMRSNAFLPDQYVFDEACKKGISVRGANPKTFDEYLNLVTKLEPPTTSMSVYSPGVNQQFNTAASIMAEPTKMPEPPMEEEQEKPKRTKRKYERKAPRQAPAEKEEIPAEVPASKKKKPEEPKPQSMPAEEPPAKKSKSKPQSMPAEEPPAKKSSSKAKSAPAEEPPSKKQKVTERTDVAHVFLAFYERILSTLSSASPAAIATVEKGEYTSITTKEYQMNSKLPLEAALFAIARLGFLEKENKFISIQELIEPMPKYLWQFSEKQLKITKHYFHGLSSAHYKNFDEFVVKSLCHRKGNTKKLIVIDGTVCEIVREVLKAQDRAAKITEILKRLNGPENYNKKLLLYVHRFATQESSVEVESELAF
jgi:flagellar motor protein MotB